MRYRCLCLDHDDTVVDSTRTIHYPSFVEYLRLTRPEIADKYSFEDYMRYNFSPGVVAFFRDMIGMSEKEMAKEEKFWADYVSSHVPAVYPGIREILWDFHTRGGIIAVDSHSYTRYIVRDYSENALPAPDIIYGWDLPPERRKPAPYTVLDIMRRFDLSPDDILVVDDSKPAYDMARAAGVRIAGAGWGFSVPEIAAFMRERCDYYCSRVDDLWQIIGLPPAGTSDDTKK